MPVEVQKFPIHNERCSEPKRALENAVVRLLKKKPFYGHLLLGFRRCLVTGQYAVGVTVTNGTPTLNVSPDLFPTYPADEQQAANDRFCAHDNPL